MIDRVFVILFAVLAGIFLLAFYAMTGTLGLPPIIQVYAGYIVGRVIGTAVHELGHGLAAVAVSLSVRQIAIGGGPVIVSRRFGETTVQLRRNPWAGGCTLLYPPLAVRKTRYMIFLLGGILGNTSLALLLIWLLRESLIPASLQPMLGGVALAQVIMVVWNLIPRDAKIDSGTIGSDGKLLLKALRNSCPSPALEGRVFAAMCQAYGGGNEGLNLASPVSARLCYQLLRERWIDEATRRDVDDALLRELRRGNLTREQELLVLDALMTDALLFRDPDLHARLDEWSLRALALAPEIETLRGSRGAALVELGRYAEAKPMLEPLARVESPLDRILSQAFLSRAEFALGNASEAKRLITVARDICDSSGQPPAIAQLIAHVETEVGAGPAGQLSPSMARPCGAPL